MGSGVKSLRFQDRGAAGNSPPPLLYIEWLKRRRPAVGKRTPLFAVHKETGARIVDFGGWDMPVHYGSQIEEHDTVRHDAGMFDVSHMTVVDITGADAGTYLSGLLANDSGRLKEPGKALYSCMLNEAGGVIDDLIVYFLANDWYRVVVNAATREKDLAWMKKRAGDANVVIAEREDTAMIAVQGPRAREKGASLLPQAAQEAALALRPFFAGEFGDLFVGRTGYTGEDGWEIICSADQAAGYWRALQAAGVHPCGLGARDTLRLEAGMNLYGSDMDETTSPLESGLAWTVAFEPEDRIFTGREALEKQKTAGVPRKFVGLVLEDRGVLRGHQRVVADGLADGEITSGTFSPTLKRSIALARVPVELGGRCQVDIRGKLLHARVVKPPFVRNGKAQIAL